MKKTIYKNEIIKRKFYDYLKNSKGGYSEKSIECFEKSIWLWEEFTSNSDFSNFNQTKAKEFKEWLKNKKKRNSKEKVSLSYCYDNLRYLRLFFGWLSEQSGYKSKINQTAIDYLTLSKKENRIATQSNRRTPPSLEDIKQTIESIEVKNEIDRRDKALISLMLLTGIRISAIASLPMESFDKDNTTVVQDPRMGVDTKNSKKITTSLMTFSYKEPMKYFLDWFEYLEEKKGFKSNDPIFPATKKENGKDNLGYFSTGEVEPIFWKGSASVRKIFEKRFKNAGVKYYNPHTFRNLLVKEISKIPLTEEEKKAFSQSLGHEQVGTTFGSYGYGHIDEDRQIEIIRSIDFEGKKKEVKQIMSFSKDELRKIMQEELKKNK
ncbi:tyrosine-type recombinase/integrase [Patescibacteria group bacterium]